MKSKNVLLTNLQDPMPMLMSKMWVFFSAVEILGNMVILVLALGWKKVL
jgi:hypothetical protein